MKRLAIDVDGVLADFEHAWSAVVASKTNMDHFWQNPPYDFWYGLAPLIHGKVFQDAVGKNEIVFLTNCPNTVARGEWLKAYGFWNDNCSLWASPPRSSKRNSLKILKPFAFIDDYPKNIKEADGLGIKHLITFDSKNPVKEWMRVKEIISGK